MPVSQIPNDANGNINPLLLSMLDTAAPVGATQFAYHHVKTLLLPPVNRTP